MTIGKKIKIRHILIVLVLISLAGILVLNAFRMYKAEKRFQEKKRKIAVLSDVLCSHWDIETRVIDIGEYRKGYIDNFDAIFLIIENYDRQIPDSLVHDILNSRDQEIVWAGYGSEALLSLLQKPNEIAQFDAGQISSLEYQDTRYKIKAWQICNPPVFPIADGIDVLAHLIDAQQNRIPFVVDIRDRFLILPLDLAFYYSVDNVSLVFLDVLHRSFGHHQAERKALLRLEDVSPVYGQNPKPLQNTYDYLKSMRIPFQVALIPRYIDRSQNMDLEIGDQKNFLELLFTMKHEGLASFIQHGYTHQKGNEITGEGYEFWDPEKNSPVRGDSRGFVLDRVKKARLIMQQNGLPVPDIWETPHYALSDLDNDTINSVYPCRYEHIHKLGALPFVAQIEGTIWFPENVGYISEGLEDIIKIDDLRRCLSVFEDPVLSVFWHPDRDIEELRSLTEMIQGGGYEFVSVYDLIERKDDKKYILRNSNRSGHETSRQVLIITALQ